MQDASNLPIDALKLIFNFLQYFPTQLQFKKVSKALRSAAIHDQQTPLDAEGALSVMFNPRTPPEKALDIIDWAFAPKADLIEKSKENSLWDSIAYMLMTNVDSIGNKLFFTTRHELGTQTSLLASTLMCTLFMTQYATSGQEITGSKKNSLEWGKDNTAFVNFKRGNFKNQILVGLKFPGSNCIETDFEGSTLDGTIFDKANCTKAKLNGASVEGTSFKGTNLMGADLSGIKGTPVFDRYTILIGAKMSWCDRRAAEKSGAILTLDDLEARIKEKPDAFPSRCLEEAKKFIQEQKSPSGIGHGSSPMFNQNHNPQVSSQANLHTPLIMNNPPKNDASCVGCTVF